MSLENPGCGANRRQGDGFVVATAIAVNDTRMFVVGANPMGHFGAYRWLAAMAQQPKNRCEVASMCPFVFGQCSIEQSFSDALDLRFGGKNRRHGRLLKLDAGGANKNPARWAGLRGSPYRESQLQLTSYPNETRAQQPPEFPAALKSEL